MEIKIATASNIELLIPAYRELRPHRSEDDIRTLLPPMFKDGFAVAYIGNEHLAFALLGFRMFTCLWSGRTLYIDDLATLSSHRNKGYAGLLFSWIKQHAKENDCEHLALNSGFQRRDAWRFYLNQGLFTESMHFGRRVEEL